MDAMVSARVPAEVRDQVNDRLRDIGSTPTELINRAYRAFLETGALPGSSADARPGRRTIDASALDELRRSIKATTFAVPESYFAGRSYDRILEEELEASYAALA